MDRKYYCFGGSRWGCNCNCFCCCCNNCCCCFLLFLKNFDFEWVWRLLSCVCMIMGRGADCCGVEHNQHINSITTHHALNKPTTCVALEVKLRVHVVGLLSAWCVMMLVMCWLCCVKSTPPCNLALGF